jgi:flagellar FliJ protein
MAAFKFRLDFLINLRRRKEEEAAQRLAKRLASIRELETHINSMLENQTQLSNDFSDHARKGSLTGALIKLYSDFLSRLRTEIKKAQELLFLSRKEEAKERQALKKAVIDRQLIEKIKEKKLESFKTETLYQEQNILEELAALSKARHQGDPTNAN